MDIVKQLPFDVCENCPEFLLSVEQKTLWYGDDGSHLVLTVQCKHSEKCKHLKRNLNILEDHRYDSNP